MAAPFTRSLLTGLLMCAAHAHRDELDSPVRYLREVRLREAHRELTVADPATTTVAGLATRWGFAHQGRFAAVYRQRYGVPPAQTLRRG